MIKLIDIALDENATEQHSDLEKALNEGYQIIGHSTFSIESRFGESNEFSGGNTPYERYTLYKPEASKPQTALDELVLTVITGMSRDETKRNRRPMWRCTTDNGQDVNVFLNEDEPEKDSYHLFKKAGWGEWLDSIAMNHGFVASQIIIIMRKSGDWWEVVKVRPRKDSKLHILKNQETLPDWAKENYLFDEIVTEEDESGDGE